MNVVIPDYAEDRKSRVGTFEIALAPTYVRGGGIFGFLGKFWLYLDLLLGGYPDKDIIL